MCEDRYGIQKLQPWQNIHQLSSYRSFTARFFLSEIPDFCHFENIIHSVEVSVSDPQKCSFSVSFGSTDLN